MALPFLLIAAFLLPSGQGRAQSSAPLEVYFYLSIPDRSTPEAWRGNRLDLPVLAEWVDVLETALTDGTASFAPVQERETADVVVEIRRCQIQEDGHFVLGGIVDPDVKAVSFELHALDTPSGLKREPIGAREGPALHSGRALSDPHGAGHPGYGGDA